MAIRGDKLVQERWLNPVSLLWQVSLSERFELCFGACLPGSLWCVPAWQPLVRTYLAAIGACLPDSVWCVLSWQPMEHFNVHRRAQVSVAVRRSSKWEKREGRSPS